MKITAVQYSATETLPVHYTLKSVAWCCDKMRLHWYLPAKLGGISFGSVVAAVPTRPVLTGCGIDFNYCFHCGAKVDITIEEVEDE